MKRYNRRKVIKNWKVVKDNLDFMTALNIFKAQAIEGHHYDLVAIRIKDRIFQPGLSNLESEQFYASEIISNKFEALIPDDQLEEKTYKLQQMFKDNNIGGLKFEKIENMTIDQLLNHLLWIIDNLDPHNKYRIAKTIIETGLYKKI
jgi:hypothetical protein